MGKSKIIHEPAGPEERRRLDEQRRAQDRVEDLAEGFTMKRHGRDGVLYYREGARVLEISYEMAGAAPGLLVYADTGLRSWVLPLEQCLSKEDRARLRTALEGWARVQPGPVTFAGDGDLIRPWEAES
jgi:hypothetical protein